MAATRFSRSAIFENSGLAVLHDGYAPESMVFAIRIGEKWNHNHADAGGATHERMRREGGHGETKISDRQ